MVERMRIVVAPILKCVCVCTCEAYALASLKLVFVNTYSRRILQLDSLMLQCSDGNNSLEAMDLVAGVLSVKIG